LGGRWFRRQKGGGKFENPRTTVIAADPADHEAASLRLYLLHFLDGLPAARIAREHREFGARFATISPRMFATVRDPAKRLRVAFLLPDLRGHSVAFFPFAASVAS